MKITLHNRISRNDVALGLIHISNLKLSKEPESFVVELDQLINTRANNPLTEQEETFRLECRNMLRNGSYKPTGRGKPANEYLLKAALDSKFPKVNSLVDINNFISLKYSVPVSVWDTDLANTSSYEFRLGLEMENYIFNAASQTISLKDLIVGCTLNETDGSRPIISPIKDSLQTKLQAQSTNIMGIIYYPLKAGSLLHLESVAEEFLSWLQQLTEDQNGQYTIIKPEENISLKNCNYFS